MAVAVRLVRIAVVDGDLGGVQPDVLEIDWRRDDDLDLAEERAVQVNLEKMPVEILDVAVDWAIKQPRPCTTRTRLG